ncbi:hypothetical protein VR45_03720, partial [Streptomyces sp. NRRL S-495]
TQSDPVPANNTANATTAVNAPAGVDLAVTRSAPSTTSIGDTPTYTVTVTNRSTGQSATGVTLTDSLTGPGTVLSAT